MLLKKAQLNKKKSLFSSKTKISPWVFFGFLWVFFGFLWGFFGFIWVYLGLFENKMVLLFGFVLFQHIKHPSFWKNPLILSFYKKTTKSRERVGFPWFLISSKTKKSLWLSLKKKSGKWARCFFITFFQI